MRSRVLMEKTGASDVRDVRAKANFSTPRDGSNILPILPLDSAVRPKVFSEYSHLAAVSDSWHLVR
jgi:hypothetical protein